MITAAIILFIISAVLFSATLYYCLAFIRPGVYPPKQVLKNKALTMGFATGILLLLGTVIIYLT